MFQLLKRFANSYENYMTKVGRSQARRILLAQDVRSLEDMGISRHLLVQGVDAWPWREGQVTVSEQRITKLAQSRKERRAIRDLRAMTNAELSDMGITRGGIVDAVRNGRPDAETLKPLALREAPTAPAKDYVESVDSDEFANDPQNAAA